MKVTNPNPCLVNVADANGKFVRIGPNQTVGVDEKAVAALLKNGTLVVAESADVDESVPDKPATKTTTRK